MNIIYQKIQERKVMKVIYYSLILFFSTYITLKASSFAAERYTSSLVSINFFLLLWLISLKLMKNNEVLLFTSTVLICLISIELLLFMLSPYKTVNEKVYGFEYQSEFYVHSMSHFKKENHEYTYKTVEFVNSFTSNNIGLRDDEVHHDSISVFIIGDSFIEGYGLDNHYTIDKHLERLIDCNKCVLNVGCKGSDLKVGFEALDTLLTIGYLPNLVILNINSTDIADFNKHFVSSVIPSKLVEFFYGSSFIFRHTYHLIYNADYLLLSPNKRKIYNQEVFKLMEGTILEYKDLLSENNIYFFVVFQPQLHELAMDESEFSLFYDMMSKENIDFFDAFNELKNNSNYKDLYWPIDRHFNKKGALVFSELVYQEIIRRNILKDMKVSDNESYEDI
jgi:hypothetical protein